MTLFIGMFVLAAVCYGMGMAVGHRHAMKHNRITTIRLIPFHPRHPSNN